MSSACPGGDRSQWQLLDKGNWGGCNTFKSYFLKFLFSLKNYVICPLLAMVPSLSKIFIENSHQNLTELN